MIRDFIYAVLEAGAIAAFIATILLWSLLTSSHLPVLP